MRNMKQKGFKNADERKALRTHKKIFTVGPVEITIEEVSPAMKKAIKKSEAKAKPKKKGLVRRLLRK